jgi:hypothetical protein
LCLPTPPPRLGELTVADGIALAETSVGETRIRVFLASVPIDRARAREELQAGRSPTLVAMVVLRPPSVDFTICPTAEGRGHEVCGVGYNLSRADAEGVVSASRSGIGGALADHAAAIRVEGGRVRGRLRVVTPAEYFEDRYAFDIEVDLPIGLAME